MLLFWFGLVDWGIAYFVHETVVERANEAVRWAVVNDYSAAKVKAFLLYGDPDSASLATPWWDWGGNVQVDVQDYDVGTVNERITVTVSNYQWFHFTPFVAGSYIARPIKVSLPIEDKHTGI